MAKNNSQAVTRDELWPYDVENEDVLALITDVPLDTRPRTLPSTLPSVLLNGRPQRFASFVPIVVDDNVAKALLEYNTVNRNLSEANIDRLSDVLFRGAWMFNGKSCMLPCTNCEIIDLQHSLHAIIRAYEKAAATGAQIKPIIIIPVIGLDPSVFATIDDGRGRQTKDTLTVAEKTGALSLNDVNETDCSTALRVMLQFINMTQDIAPSSPLYLGGLRSKIPNYRATEMMKSFPQLMDSLTFCNGLPQFHNQRPVITVAIGGALHALISEVQSTTAANNFVRSLISGANLEETSPIYKLREQLIHDQGRKIRAEAVEKLATCIRGWNYVADGVAPPRNKRIPALGYKDGITTFPMPKPMQRRRAAAS